MKKWINSPVTTLDIVGAATTGGAKSWEPFLDACPSFQLVKSFKNENSGSIVKIWLSTN